MVSTVVVVCAFPPVPPAEIQRSGALRGSILFPGGSEGVFRAPPGGSGGPLALLSSLLQYLGQST